MKSITIIATLIALFSLSTTSCNKKVEPNEVPPQKSIGTYSFDNKEFNLASAAYNQDAGFIYMLFASQDIATEKISSYFSLSLRNEYIGAGPIAAESHTHNFDYAFIFETPLVLYPDYKSVTGTIEIIENSVDNFTVKLDIKLADKKSFKLDYTGPITKQVEQ